MQYVNYVNAQMYWNKKARFRAARKNLNETRVKQKKKQSSVVLYDRHAAENNNYNNKYNYCYINNNK